MTSTAMHLGVDAFVGLLAAAVLVSILAERIRVPAAVLLVAVGAAAGTVLHVKPPFEFAPALLFVFLPPLIFEAAWNIDLPLLRRCLGRIALLAFPGTLIIAFAIAAAIAAVGALPFGAALLFGAMVAATDPVAVIAVFRRVGVPAELKTIVEGESLANDGVAVVLYGIALTLAQGGSVNWLVEGAHGIVEVVGGVAVGAVCAIVVWRVMRHTDASEYEVTITVALAYIAYLAADGLALSGIFATASGGVLLRFLQRRNDRVLVNVDDADRFWDTGASIANAMVFIATGLLIDVPRMLHEPLLIFAALAVVLVSRALLVVAVVSGRRARITVFLAGMRGALPLALAISLPATVPHRPEIIDAVFATVFVTLVLQGLSLRAVVRRLYRDADQMSKLPERSS